MSAIDRRTARLCANALRVYRVTPVLVDVGAAGGTFPAWNPIAGQSVYVGFDPDRREMGEITGSRYLRATIVNQAVTADGAGKTRFYLTRSPQCSSTLPPRVDELRPYLFSDRFIVEREAEAEATTLDAVVAQLALGGIDWLKLDTQGTDLRLLQSVRPETRDRILAVDVEPGLIDAYQGEDKFSRTHEAMLQEGFWLAEVQVKGTVRLSRPALAEALRRRPGLKEEGVAAMTASPGWCESRYLRSIEWLRQRNAGAREFVLLWTFALMSGHAGFAFEAGLEFERRFSQQPEAQALAAAALDLLPSERPLGRRLREALPPGIKRALKRLLGREPA